MIKFDDASLFNDAKKHLVGGVNSPVRAFKGVGGVPVFVKRALGAHIFDHEDKRYIDYVGSWGPMILGHAHPDIVRAVQLAAANGLSFGAPTALESEVATLICARYGLDKIRFTSSGTEATMSAIRLARGYTGRDDIVKFEGCYHGHSDSLLVKAGSGMLDIDTQELGDCVGAPSSLGVPEDFAKHTRVLPYNDIEALERYFALHGDSTACVIVEPIAGNMNMIIPSQAFHNTLRSLCTKHGVVLIFDEVMTGFRVGLKGRVRILELRQTLVLLARLSVQACLWGRLGAWRYYGDACSRRWRVSGRNALWQSFGNASSTGNACAFRSRFL